MTQNREIPAARHEFASLEGQRYAAGAELSAAASAAIFARDGSISRLTVRVPRHGLQLDRPAGPN